MQRQVQTLTDDGDVKGEPEDVRGWKPEPIPADVWKQVREIERQVKDDLPDEPTIVE